MLHPKEKAIFVGDFINRGPQIRKTIGIIRKMVENDEALAILGNHEINAIIAHIKDKKGNPLVKPPFKNFFAILKTINEFVNYSEEWQSHLKWLRTLPLFLELDGFRVVHACWSDEAVQFINQNLPPGKIKKQVFRKIHKNPESELAQNIWILTKGLQFKMPRDLRIISNKGEFTAFIQNPVVGRTAGKTFEGLSFESKFRLPEYTIPQKCFQKHYPTLTMRQLCFLVTTCRKKATQFRNLIFVVWIAVSARAKHC